MLSFLEVGDSKEKSITGSILRAKRETSSAQQTTKFSTVLLVPRGEARISANLLKPKNQRLSRIGEAKSLSGAAGMAGASHAWMGGLVHQVYPSHQDWHLAAL